MARTKEEAAAKREAKKNARKKAVASAERSNPRPKRVIPAKPAAPAAAAPARKKVVVKKPKAASKRTGSERKTKPTYQKMIFKALKELGDLRSGSGYQSIYNYIESNYPVKEGFARYLKLALRKLTDDEDLVRVKSSYRISSKARARVARKKSSRRKKATTKSTGEKKSSAKKSGETKKRAAPKKKSAEKEKPASKKRAAPKKSSEKPTSKRAKKATEESPKKRAAPKKTADKEKPSPKKARAKAKSNVAEPASGSSEVSAASGAAPTAAKPVGLKGDYVWQYEDNGWKNYDVNASNTVEDVYQGYLANRGDTDVRAVKSGQWEYMVDFMAMKQTNIQHDNHTVRNIRRVKTSA